MMYLSEYEIEYDHDLTIEMTGDLMERYEYVHGVSTCKPRASMYTVLTLRYLLTFLGSCLVIAVLYTIYSYRKYRDNIM